VLTTVNVYSRADRVRRSQRISVCSGATVHSGIAQVSVPPTRASPVTLRGPPGTGAHTGAGFVRNSR
jgi:hypothetical protein